LFGNLFGTDKDYDDDGGPQTSIEDNCLTNIISLRSALMNTQNKEMYLLNLIKQLCIKYRNLENTLSSTGSHLEKSLTDNKDNRGELDNLRNEIERLTTELEKVTKERNDLLARLKQNEILVTKLTDENNELKQQIGNLQQGQDVNELIGKYCSKLGDLAVEIQDTHTQLNSNYTQISSIINSDNINCDEIEKLINSSGTILKNPYDISDIQNLTHSPPPPPDISSPLSLSPLSLSPASLSLAPSVPGSLSTLGPSPSLSSLSSGIQSPPPPPPQPYRSVN